MKVEVAYALPTLQAVVAVELPDGATVRQAIERSGLTGRFPEIDLARQRVGIFGRVVALDRVVEEGERVEIYRPLQADPRSQRRARVTPRRR